MRTRYQLELGLFPDDGPAPYPAEPTAIVVSVSGGLDSDYAALRARQRWPRQPLILWRAFMPRRNSCCLRIARRESPGRSPDFFVVVFGTFRPPTFACIKNGIGLC